MQLEAFAKKGNQGLTWDEEEDALLAQHFARGTKITELAKIHSRTYGAIKARLLRMLLESFICGFLDVMLP